MRRKHFSISTLVADQDRPAVWAAVVDCHTGTAERASHAQRSSTRLRLPWWSVCSSSQWLLARIFKWNSSSWRSISHTFHRCLPQSPPSPGLSRDVHGEDKTGWLWVLFSVCMSSKSSIRCLIRNISSGWKFKDIGTQEPLLAIAVHIPNSLPIILIFDLLGQHAGHQCKDHPYPGANRISAMHLAEIFNLWKFDFFPCSNFLSTARSRLAWSSLWWSSWSR